MIDSRKSFSEIKIVVPNERKTHTKHISEHDDAFWMSEKIPDDEIRVEKVRKRNFEQSKVGLVSILFDWISDQNLAENIEDTLLK